MLITTVESSVLARAWMLRGFTACGLLLTVILPACGECNKNDLTPEFVASVKDQGDKLRDGLETFRDLHGHYPSSLEELALPKASRQASCGTVWTYEPRPSGYELRFGTYTANYFEITWDQGLNEWLVDH